MVAGSLACACFFYSFSSLAAWASASSYCSRSFFAAYSSSLSFYSASSNSSYFVARNLAFASLTLRWTSSLTELLLCTPGWAAWPLLPASRLDMESEGCCPRGAASFGPSCLWWFLARLESFPDELDELWLRLLRLLLLSL